METYTVEFTWTSNQLSDLQKWGFVWCHREVSVGDEEDSGGWYSLKSCILES